MKTIITIIIIVAVLVIVVGIVALVWWSGKDFSFFKKEIQQKGEEVKFSPEEYANQKGYKKYFQYQGQWYENINEEWISVEKFAEQKGYEKYFSCQGRWYANVDGKWKLVSSKEEAKQLSEIGGEK